jgi:AraC family transcriptional regulator
MTAEQPLVIEHDAWPELLVRPPLLSSFQSSWQSIQLAHFRQTSINLPELSSAQDMIIIPVCGQGFDYEMTLEGRLHKISHHQKDIANGCIQVMPADLPHSLYSSSTVEWIHCYLEPRFLSQIAYETVNPDRVGLLPALKKADPLIFQIGLSLRSCLEQDGIGNRFYADSMATALSAQLLRHYSTRKPRLQAYEDGLSSQKLGQAIDYIRTHLSADLSLSAIATELEMSQYYFCRLFKQSTGISPHQYLMQQRLEKAKTLLRQQLSSKRTITCIAIECGFANQSHFARYFRQQMGMSPTQFREL